MLFGENFKKYRLEAGLSQKQVAKMLDIYQSNISDWENDVSRPDYEKLIQLSKIYGHDVPQSHICHMLFPPLYRNAASHASPVGGGRDAARLDKLIPDLFHCRHNRALAVRVGVVHPARARALARAVVQDERLLGVAHALAVHALRVDVDALRAPDARGLTRVSDGRDHVARVAQFVFLG